MLTLKRHISKFAIFPLVILLAMVPVLCCCFDQVASASPAVSEHSEHKSAHCAAQAESETQSDADHDSHHDCDCPRLLAEGSLSNVKAIAVPADASRNSFDVDLRLGLIDIAIDPQARSSVSSRDNPGQSPGSPPLYILHRALRI